MPFRIWMPSCAAGPLNTAAWPSLILSAVTPVSAFANTGAQAIAMLRRMRLIVISPSNCYRQKLFVAHQRADIELAPAPAVLVFVFGAQPRRALAARLARAQLGGIAQPERAVHEQRRRAAEALAEEHQARLVSRAGDTGAEELGEVHHAIEVAAHVR